MPVKERDYIEGTKPFAALDEGRNVMHGNKISQTLQELEEDYNECYRLIRKTYDYLEKIGLRDFNKFSKYTWSFDKDSRGYGYVCIRAGSSLMKKSLVKRSGTMDEADLLRWLDNKDLICEAIDEAYEYIDAALSRFRSKMDDMKNRLKAYEDKAAAVDADLDAVKVMGGAGD